MSITPHGPGFSFLDEFEIMQEGKEGRGRKWLDPALPFFADHFPGRPIMPGVLLIECGAQTAGALWAAILHVSAGTSFVLAQVVQFKILRPVLPACTVETTALLDNRFDALAQFSLTLRVDGVEVAFGRIVLARTPS
jgi:3-hydroxyacyl-[acyl-carrier-protein] dehydratase